MSKYKDNKSQGEKPSDDKPNGDRSQGSTSQGNMSQGSLGNTSQGSTFQGNTSQSDMSQGSTSQGSTFQGNTSQGGPSQTNQPKGKGIAQGPSNGPSIQTMNKQNSTGQGGPAYRFNKTYQGWKHRNRNRKIKTNTTANEDAPSAGQPHAQDGTQSDVHSGISTRSSSRLEQESRDKVPKFSLATPRVHRHSAFGDPPHLIYYGGDEYHPRVGYSVEAYAELLEKKYIQENLRNEWSIADLSDVEPFPRGPCLTRAPLAMGLPEKPLSASIAKPGAVIDISKEATITQVLTLDELAEAILQHVSFPDLLSLSMTRSVMFAVVGKHLDVWDATHGHYNKWDKSDHQLALAEKRGDYTKDGIDGFESVVAKRSTCGRILVTSVHSRREHSFSKSFESTVKLLRGLHHVQSGLKTLYLNRVPFLDMNLMGILLKDGNFPKLQKLGIFNCELLHFSATYDLLKLLKERVDSGMPPVAFDFAPRFHRGPDDVNREGSFGVTWNDEGIDTDRAIFGSLLYWILPLAEELGIDLISPNTAFRQFLEKLPLTDWSVPRVLHHFVRGTFSGLEPTSRRDTSLSHNVAAEMLYTIITHGNPQRSNSALFRKVSCTDCRRLYPLFVMRSPVSTVCSACHMAATLRDETDHYKVHQRSVVQMFIGVIGPKRLPQPLSLAELIKVSDDDGDQKNEAFRTHLWRFQRARGLAMDLDSMHEVNVHNALRPHRPKRGHYIIGMDNPKQWPGMGPGDWYENCPQAVHDCRVEQECRRLEQLYLSRGMLIPRLPLFNGAHYEICSGYMPAGNWDVKQRRYKPRPSVNSIWPDPMRPAFGRRAIASYAASSAFW